jgi:hypothetical protein
MNEFNEAIEDVQNLLDAAATDARDVADLPTQNAIGMLIRAVAQLRDAVVVLAKA